MRQKLFRGRHQFPRRGRQDPPFVYAAACMVGKSVKAGLLGFARTPMVLARGTRSCKSCRRLASSAMPSRLTPVTFSPGRLSDATSPPFTASELDVNTIGIFGVAAFADRPQLRHRWPQ